MAEKKKKKTNITSSNNSKQSSKTEKNKSEKEAVVSTKKHSKTSRPSKAKTTIPKQPRHELTDEDELIKSKKQIAQKYLNSKPTINTKVTDNFYKEVLNSLPSETSSPAIDETKNVEKTNDEEVVNTSEYKRVFTSPSAYLPVPKKREKTIDAANVFLVMSDNFFLSEKIITSFLQSVFQIFSIQGMPVCSNRTPTLERPLIVPVLDEFKNNIDMLVDDVAFDNLYLDANGNFYFHSVSFFLTWTLHQNNLIVPCFSWKDLLDKKDFFSKYDVIITTIYISQKKHIHKKYSQVLNLIDYKLISKDRRKLHSYFFNIINLFYPYSLKNVISIKNSLEDNVANDIDIRNKQALQKAKKQEIEDFFKKSK